MTLDYFFIEALAAQLDARLAGSMVKKIHQPRADLLIFQLWNGRTEQRLELSCASGNVYMCISAARQRNPMQPPRFCQLLRARLNRLVSIRTLGLDRRVGLYFESGAHEKYCLVLDMFGRNANMLLFSEDNHIVDKLRRPIVPPQAQHMLPFSTTGSVFDKESEERRITLEHIADTPDLRSVEKIIGSSCTAASLQEQVTPMSRTTAQRLMEAIDAADNLQPLLDFARAWNMRRLVPYRRGKVLSMWIASENESSPQHDTDLNHFLCAQLHSKESDAGAYSPDPDLSALVAKMEKKLRKRRASIEAELEACIRHADYQREAELLDAHRYMLKRGMDKVTVQNYYTDPPEEVTLKLNPSRTVQENIDKAYARARKARRGLEHCERRLEETANELEWLADIAFQLRRVDSAADEELIRTQLLEHGYLRPQKTSRRRQRHVNPADLVRRCMTPGGFQLLWGRNSQTNAYLSRRLLKADDMWFHAHNAPGAHVVLKTEGREPADEDIRIAAALAAYYSDLRDETHAAVIQAHGRDVRHPKGGRPGMVNLNAYVTLNVTPQSEDGLCIG
jgi:predicted ribosome quality control (RQC) complex YloA/Tae2 family protein